ncbi:hypothetical protein IGB42_03108 [Andreprevotia sp. IGB-42]|uniref:pilus assembly PilX family protein n=1 Tax=Andreprevotia sp. IGB-42 TaxID=2497473 RepID=UPI00135853C5|nr:PilX N-terminal domain-containing pilus assembly protein [Andreprevotia sp. IGB-42]KAF0812440.1 hypothetical protein IGB42_03108 [Andreprevotia sp. IGB-42]
MHNHHSRGFVLITSLIFLITLTIIVVYAVRTATMREHIAGNFRTKSQAFEAAEFALRRAQGVLSEYPTFTSAVACQKGLCGSQVTSAQVDALAWDDTDTCRINDTVCNRILGANKTLTATLGDSVAEQPRWVIRELANGTKGPCTYYEISSRGVGSNDKSAVVLRSIVKAC